MSYSRLQNRERSPNLRRPRSAGAPSIARRRLEEERTRAFLRMASHELRTPLNAIIGFSEIIARELYGPLNEPRYREQAEIIRESGLKLLGLVNQVMEIARLESGAADLDIRPELPELPLEKAIAAVKDEALAREVRVEIDRAGLLSPVMADPRALKTVFVNLLSNALTVSPFGSTITARITQAGGLIRFDIIDRGPGVAPSQLTRLMQPFEQGEDVLTRRGQGAGLGLPIAALLCREMGGRLRLQSEPGAGLTARVTLPAALPGEP